MVLKSPLSKGKGIWGGCIIWENAFFYSIFSFKYAYCTAFSQLQCCALFSVEVVWRHVPQHTHKHLWMCVFVCKFTYICIRINKTE